MSIDERQAFEIAAGTVTGRSHVASGKGNQDAYAFRTAGPHLAAVVCDGCGSGAHSEVGAHLGARLVVAQILGRLAKGASVQGAKLWSDVRGDVLDGLDDLVRTMGGKRSETVSELFLFTIVGVAMDAESACVFSIGDGLIALGDDVIRLGPFPRNEPPYLAYGLLDRSGGPRFMVHRTRPVAEVSHVLLGTDGACELEGLASRALPGSGDVVGPLRQLWTDDRYFANRDALRRRLALINREVAKPVWAERRMARQTGLLEDDTTVVVLRRRQQAQP